MASGERYTTQIGMYPVFSLTLKSAKQKDYDMAYYMMQTAISMEFERHRCVVEKGKEQLSSREYSKCLKRWRLANLARICYTDTIID